MGTWDAIAEQIGAATGERFVVRGRDGVGGGCINAAWRVSDGKRSYFVKTHGAAVTNPFEVEAEGLAAIAATRSVRVPRPIAWGSASGEDFLILEHLDLSGRAADEALGRQLAAMHRATAANFGWYRDNFIGATPQPNGWRNDWITFWREQRIGYQLNLAATRGARRLVTRGEELLARLPEFFAGYEPVPSLLHGDLWSGNASATSQGEPVIFDPAVYYGDPETDLAMTELFGGFGARFYAAYREARPLDVGYETRKSLYNLYHLLNHFNLFGGGYGAQSETVIDRLLAERH